MYINDDDVKDKFTMVDNFVLHKCPYLSLKAKAILIYIKSKPKGWVVTQSEIIKNVKDSRQAVASGLRELEEHKHLYRDQLKTEEGRFGHVFYLASFRPLKEESAQRRLNEAIQKLPNNFKRSHKPTVSRKTVSGNRYQSSDPTYVPNPYTNKDTTNISSNSKEEEKIIDSIESVYHKSFGPQQVKTFVRFLRQDNCLLNPDTVDVVVRLTEKFGTRNDLIPRYPNYIYRKGLQVFKNYRTLAQEWVESLTNEINLLEPDDELLELYELALRECREDRNIIYTLLSNPEEYDQEWESDFNWILLIPIYELDESEKTPDLKIFSKKLIDSGRIPYCLLDEIDTGLNEKELKEVFQKEHLDKLKASQVKRVEELSEVRRQLEQFITEISEIC